MLAIIPAIDIKDGQCVRLQQGRADRTKVYSNDPISAAKRWVDEGAGRLHIVDLDGAFRGRPVNGDIIARIAEAVPIPVQVGGGLRTEDDIAQLLSHGVARAIIGTRAFVEPEALQGLIAQFGNRLAVAIDAKNGRVQVGGWVETTDMPARDLAARVDAAGIKTIIYTDTMRDGMMKGTNASAADEICGIVKCDVIASGGITTAADIRALAGLNRRNLIAAIVGKALYEGSVTLRELTVAGDCD